MNKNVNRRSRLAAFDFEIAVGAPVLSRFIDSGVGDPELCAKQSRPATVADGKANTGGWGGPTQVLATSVEDQYGFMGRLFMG